MGSLLQSLGANVIKIEQPITGDPARDVSPWGFLNYNYGKKSITLNLKVPRGQEILRKLVKVADIFLENMGPDVPQRLGFSYNSLRRINPRLIYCSIKGFSKGSQYRNKPAFDAVAQAMSGMMSLTGEPHREPLRIGNPAVDLGAAAYGTIEVLAALLERQRSGRGRFIEVSLLDMSVYWNGYWLTYYGVTRKIPERLGSGHLGYSPHRVFKTKDGRYVLIAALSDAQWKRLSQILGIVLGSAFDTMKYRLAHRVEVEKAVEDAVSKLDVSEALALLGESVPCAPVRSIAEVYDDEELCRFGVLREIRDGGGVVRVAASPIHHERKGRLSAPELGRDTERVVGSLGYTRNQVRRFRGAGVI
jgi:crotonobetainyl-CoA:carnitine CoA-transferase CaiB-like acyl-CoA transferase